MKGMTTEVRSQWEEGSFRRIFWEQQLEALKVKDSRQIRWLPAMIRRCLHLRFKSSGAYRSLRESGAVVLPSERTLIDYTHWCKRGAGFIPDVDEILLKEIGDLGEERRKYVVLCFDEMKIKENLVFDKHSFSLVGFYNMGDVSNAISEVQSQSAGKENATSKRFAKYMLSFYVRGIFTNVNFPYAHFPIRGATAGELYLLVWDAILHLEMLGLKVMAVTCDGAATNRKFFKMHKLSSDLEGSTFYKTENLYSEEKRFIYFISDVPHLIKTVRNCRGNSYGRNRHRALWVSRYTY